MIGESTPRGFYTNISDTWGVWFAPLIGLLNSYPIVQLVSYIDQDWVSAEGGRWPGCGDARVELPAAGVVGSNWRAELAKPRWANRANKTEIRALLGLTP
jgi:hypothetical protein